MKGIPEHMVPPPAAQPISRRRDVRLDAPSQLAVAVPTAQGPLALRDLSVRGLCLVAQAPLPLKSVHQVTLRFGHITFAHRAVAVYCRSNPGGGWLIGMEFVGEAPAQKFTIDDLVDELVGAAISFSS